jgi:hypothetical protein
MTWMSTLQQPKKWGEFARRVKLGTLPGSLLAECRFVSLKEDALIQLSPIDENNTAENGAVFVPSDFNAAHPLANLHPQPKPNIVSLACFTSD